MQPASSTDERGDTVQRTYATVDWNYPPSRATLLARGASHSRFLRIAHSSHTNSPPNLHRRKQRWPKPPHYHASLLRSPLSCRKGLFRAVLSPNNAVDFVRWDIFAGAGSFSNQTGHACTSLHVAECVLEPYEAAAGFSGWHGLGIDLTRRVQVKSGAGECPSDLHREIDEATVDEGRARWTSLAQELVGPPGIALRWIQSSKGVDSAGPCARQEVRWDPDIGSTPFRPPRATPAPDDKRGLASSSSSTSFSGSASASKPHLKVDPPSAWWYAPSSHRGPPHLYPLRFPHTPHVQYGPPPAQFPSYFPGRLPSAQAHGDWYTIQHTGAPSVNHPVKSHPPHSHSHRTPARVHSSKCPHPYLSRDEYEPGHDGDKEIETDHDYESTTTTTDSDPPPHTPIGAATTSHCAEAPQLHGDDDETELGSAALRIPLSDPTTPVKLLPRFVTSPSASSSSSDLNRAASKAVVFPSLNGSFRQGSVSHKSAFSSSQGTSTPTTPARASTMAGSISRSAKGTSASDSEEEDTSKTGVLETNPAFMLSLSSPPPTSPGSALRKDSQGFWEPVTPISPCSSLSSLPLSPSESRIGAKFTTRRLVEPPEANGSCPVKCRSLSPGPRRETSVDSLLSSSSRPTTFPSPTSTPASASVFGGSYPCSPSNGAFLFPPKPTTLLPAFLATTGEKRKKTSRTREIVDQLRSSSIDVGKGMEGLGWLNGTGEPNGAADNVSDHTVESHVSGQPSSPPPLKSRLDSTPLSGSDSASSRTCESGPRGSGGKSNGTTTGPETCSSTAPRPGHNVTPFPILSVSPTSPSNLTAARRDPCNVGDSPKKNVVASTSPSTRFQLLPDTPNNGTSPSTHRALHPLPSPTHPTVHLQPVLGPPMLAVAAYPPPMYVPCAQYSIVPPQGQGGWVAMYPGRPAHIPVHPIPAQVHITGVSGMRHVSW